MTINSRDADIAPSLFNTAVHVATPHAEAQVARDMLLKLFERNGFTFDDLIATYRVATSTQQKSIFALLQKISALEKSFQATDRKLRSTEQSYLKVQGHLSKSADEILKLKQAVEDAQAKCDRLQKQNDALEAQFASPNHSGDEGQQYVDFADFTQRAHAKFGHKRWKSAFAHHLHLPLKQIAAWATVGIVPIKFLEALDTMSELDRKPASRQQWTRAELRRLGELVGQSPKPRDHDMAQALSGEFKRRIFESSITARRRHLERQRREGERQSAVA